jgi:DNA-binding MarR family transcriptional regulator
MTDEVITALAERGHPGVRAVHEFALRAIDTGADTASELGRRLSVSKQAAAKTIAALQALGYVEIEPHPADGRRRRIRVTPGGRDMVAIGSASFDDVRERWAAQIGAEQLEALQAHLGRLVTPRPLGAEDLARVADADADTHRRPVGRRAPARPGRRGYRFGSSKTGSGRSAASLERRQPARMVLQDDCATARARIKRARSSPLAIEDGALQRRLSLSQLPIRRRPVPIAHAMVGGRHRISV